MSINRVYNGQMHYIQSYILDKLITAKSLRNKDMRPKGVESNVYQYHLKQLQKDRFIHKTNAAYTLSAKGLAYADRQSGVLKKVRVQPKVVTILVAQNKRGEFLVRKKRTQPFIETVSLVGGKVHVDEMLHDAAMREYLEKICDDPTSAQFEQQGVVHFVVKQDTQVISDYIGFVMHIKLPVGMSLKNYVYFADIDQLSPADFAPGAKEVLDAVRRGDIFTEAVIDYQPM